MVASNGSEKDQSNGSAQQGTFMTIHMQVSVCVRHGMGRCPVKPARLQNCLHVDATNQLADLFTLDVVKKHYDLANATSTHTHTVLPQLWMDHITAHTHTHTRPLTHKLLLTYAHNKGVVLQEQALLLRFLTI